MKGSNHATHSSTHSHRNVNNTVVVAFLVARFAKNQVLSRANHLSCSLIDCPPLPTTPHACALTTSICTFNLNAERCRRLHVQYLSFRDSKQF